ncbi:GAF domain-containing sensor histidine kinase [Nostocoides sp. HKS02]|uniref:GAF domain-containing sensor histidine kinase n=1 Tax=Nostocoides sp. HKS02 TaxID=1813880 RepID=UPI0012B4A70F|nr:GAF domain-containing sensor histidine kinase [Tetrasphaera sp. HKS02]QGN56811.1 GAF domain-containing protein [Tetrasphaera sp. HKS02]
MVLDPKRERDQGRWSETVSLEVDDLMEELRARATAARRSHEQLEALLDAVTAMSANLELSVVLGRIVRSACALVNARYGALGVLSPDGEHLVEFVTHGISPEERARIGDPPRGHGILGLLIRDPRPRRLANLAAHPDSYGFPPNHPPMRSFLGAPIRIRDEVFGNLYLAESGNTEFSEADETILVALASAAGFAIDNARMYERSEQQRLWGQAISELTRSLLESPVEAAALPPMVERACALAGARLCAVALVEQDGQSWIHALHSADHAARASVSPATWPALEGAQWSEILGSDQELLLVPGSQPGAAQRVASDLSEAAGLVEAGPTAVLPMAAGSGAIGHLLVQWEPGQEDAASQVMPALSGFAQQVGLAIIAARAQHDRALVAQLEDRDRIARDMHDHVIQRLFATGLSLQSAGRFAVHPVVQARLDEAVESLDVAIKDIRSTIFALHTTPPAAQFESELRALVETYAASLGYTPDLVLEGDSTQLDPDLANDLLAVVREGLSNVSRHAQASAATVRLSVGPSLTVAITDNGKGVDAMDRRSGLANLERRATVRSGTFGVEPVEPSGTRITWVVPLSA